MVLSLVSLVTAHILKSLKGKYLKVWDPTGKSNGENGKSLP